MKWWGGVRGKSFKVNLIKFKKHRTRNNNNHIVIKFFYL